MNNAETPEEKIDRRSFMNRSVKAAAGTALATSALSYSRILGANDRISLGHIGLGSRGRGLDEIVTNLKDPKVEMTAVCDLWKVHRERAVATNTQYYGRAPRSFQYLEDLLALKDIDAVLISTPDHSHSPILKLAAEAGKDAYVEKPMAHDLEDAKAARDAVLQRKRIVQVGTQHRSEPYTHAAHKLFRTGVCGDVSLVQINWNFHGPRWANLPEVKQIREEDTDWAKWLMQKPYRPFDPQIYFEFRLFREFSSGIVGLFMSHAMDLVQWFMDDYYPHSVSANGGIFAWHDERQNPDTFGAVMTYPKGFMATYVMTFGNDTLSFCKYMGKKATLTAVGMEGTPRYELVEEKGNYEQNPYIGKERKTSYVLLPEDKEPPPPGQVDGGDLTPYHMMNWFDCLRTRKQPIADIMAGYTHSVTCIMCAEAYWSGKKLYWDPETETILDHPPVA
jgi:predicted dehydrogenase